MHRRMKDINFLGNRNIMFIISAVFIVITIAVVAFRGLNFGIEFTGGTSIAFNNVGDIDIADMRSAFDETDETEVVIQTVVSNGEPGFLVRTSQTNPDVAAAEAQQIAERFGLPTDSYQVTTIGPDWGGNITRSSIMAFFVSIIAIVIYIAWRFQFKMGVMAVVALFHDLIIVIGIYAIVGREITPNVIAALLTILGYSLYDTVVVFHRIVDNAEEGKMKCSLMKLANHSINQVFIRTVNTALAQLIPVLVLLFFGGETLKDFAFAMAIGLVCGAYSSIAISTPLYVLWKEREPKYAKLKKRYPDDLPSTRRRKQLEREAAAAQVQ
ncbi:MAG: protein translocase subunit SecF [Actinomycetota bacterium]|nr:protein translocase subunit SecF [Actinomycetota bacterium]